MQQKFDYLFSELEQLSQLEGNFEWLEKYQNNLQEILATVEDLTFEGESKEMIAVLERFINFQQKITLTPSENLNYIQGL